MPSPDLIGAPLPSEGASSLIPGLAPTDNNTLGSIGTNPKLYPNIGDSSTQPRLDSDEDSPDLIATEPPLANTFKTQPHPDTLIINNTASNSVKEALSGLPLQDSNQANTDLDPLTGDFIVQPSAIADINHQSSRKTDSLIDPGDTTSDNSTILDTQTTPVITNSNPETDSLTSQQPTPTNAPITDIKTTAELTQPVTSNQTDTKEKDTAISETASDKANPNITDTTGTSLTATPPVTEKPATASDTDSTTQKAVTTPNNEGKKLDTTSDTDIENVNKNTDDTTPISVSKEIANQQSETATTLEVTSEKAKNLTDSSSTEIAPTVSADSLTKTTETIPINSDTKDTETQKEAPIKSVVEAEKIQIETSTQQSDTPPQIAEEIKKPTVATDSNKAEEVKPTVAATDSNKAEEIKPTVANDSNKAEEIKPTVATDSKITEEIKPTVVTDSSKVEEIKPTVVTDSNITEEVEPTVETADSTSVETQIEIVTSNTTEKVQETILAAIPTFDQIETTLLTALTTEKIDNNTPKQEPISSQINSNSNNSLIEKTVNVQQPEAANATSPLPTPNQTLTPTEPQTQIAANQTTNIPNTLDDNNNTSTNPSPTIAQETNSNPTFTSGVFTVGTTGIVSIDYLFDGGLYQGELAVFSLSNMEGFTPGTPAFIAEAARRALTNSELGNIAIKDSTEGARFSGKMPGESNWNIGQYQGPTTFNMTPGDTFGIMLIPNGTVQQVHDNPSIGGTKRPLFSLSTANPAEGLQVGQIADVTGNGNTFAYEDLRVDGKTDKDFNDIIFNVTGATGIAPPLSSSINPSKEWRNSPIGQELIDYVLTLTSDNTPPAIAASLIQDTGSSNSDRLTNNPTISGTITDSSNISSFKAAFNNNSTNVELKNLLAADGSFTLTRDILKTINNGSELPDGTHTIELQAVDIHGNTSNFELAFTLDTTTSVTLSLDPAFDTPPTGDSDTENSTVTLQGQTEPLSTIILLETGAVATANATGKFQFPGVILTPGSNSFTATTTDKAGNSSTTTLTVKYNPPRTNKVPTDLGGAYTFTGRTTSGNNDAGSANQYTFGITNSELNSTDSDTVLVGVSVASKDNQGLPELPEVTGLTPILTSTDTNSTYSLFSINRSGLNLLNLSGASSGAYTLQLNVAGDINSDGRVDTTDRQLLDNALGSTATDPAYTIDSDINRDGIINSADQTLFNSNFGFSANLPPVASPFWASTHAELETIVPLIGKATDPEGDPIFYNALNPVNGTVQFDPITKTATFKPTPGFSGVASFDFIASDGYNWGVPAKVTVNVSGAPLLSLDFANRNPQLYAGESTELIVLGDFADQKGVVLPDSYLTYTSFNPEVAPIDAFGKVTGLADGTSIFSASHKNLQAVTAARVGELPAPTNDAEFNSALAEINGLNVYPKAVTMTTGMARSLLVGIENIIQSPDLKLGSTGTRYFPGNSNLLQVNADGIITAIEEGVTNVTVIHGAAEQVVPVRVSLPAAAGTILGVNGGAVTGSDGSIVMVPPGALAENTAISLTSLSSNALSLQLPDGLQFAGGFNLDLGDQALKLPAQLAIPAPADLSPGTEVLFMRKGSLPDANNIQNPTWLIQESGVVDANGTIRTNSPPFSGILESGEYAMFALPLGLVGAPTVQQLVNLGISQAATGSLAASGGAAAINLSTNFGLQSTFLAANAGLIGIAAITTAQFAATILLLAYLAKYLKSELKVIAIPKVGLPVVTPAGVGLDPEGIPSVTATLNIPTLFPADPFAPPVLQSAEFKLENGSPEVVLTGSNFLNNSGDLGDEFKDLTVSFRVGDKTYPGIVIPEKSTDLGENRYKIAVKIPITVPVGESSIVVSRKQKKRFGLGVGDYEIVELESEENIRLAPTCVELALVTERTGDKINVINLKDASSTVETQSSAKLAVAINIPVGNPNIQSDRPESIAPTNNATRGYVTLRDTGRVSVVDLIALREIDTTPETETVDAISLPNGARPQAIVIDPKDNYAYIADQNRPNIYVLDINPNSATYHTVVKTINVTSPLGLSQLAISSDGRRLFATGSDNNEQTPNRNIYAVNIDPADKPSAQGANERKWHQQIGVIPTASETEGITATSDPMKMVFTNGLASVLAISNGEQIKLQDDGKGFGVLKIESDDPLNFSAEVRYAPLSLGAATDYFDVNEAVAVTVTQDGKYAFVAGRNSRANINTREGGNIGIIANPLTPNPQLVAATRPIPDSLTNNLALSSDGKYLIASYPTTNLGGSSYVFDVEEMIKAIENPGNYKLDARDRGVGSVGFATNTERNATQADLARVPIDDINPLVSIAADYEITGGNWINNFTFSVPDGTKRAPIGIGGNPKGLAIASAKNWLELEGPIGTSESESNPLTPTFEWDLKGDGEECGLPGFNPDTDVKEVNLYVSVFPQGNGLLPDDRWEGLKSNEEKDYNPNRVLTAKWQDGMWTWDGRSQEGSSEEFTLPDYRRLTAGQEYHWAVEAVTNKGDTKVVTNKFKTLLPAPISGDTFSSVTVLTRGLEPGTPEHSQLIDSQLNGIAKNIFDGGGVVKKYNPVTGKWQSVTLQGNDWIPLASNASSELGKPLVLLANWMEGIEPQKLYNSGFAEAAADVLFASMVQLDLEKGGSIGKEGKLYDSTGKLIRTQGAVFNSPLHFVGFGQGAVVNSEIVQRLGTFLPDAGGTSLANRDLQMTTIDPYDYDDNSFSGPYRNILDPEIKVWNNVTYADNYYQTNGSGNTINGRELSGTNWKSDWNVSLNNLAGFTPDDGAGSSHRAALAWYAGTANLNESQFPSENGETIYRRLGDLAENNIADATKTWYTPDHTNASFTHGDTKAPWEGIGTGWFDSVLGGGSQLRPYFDGGKKSKSELGDFEDYLKNNRVSVYEDNTYTDSTKPFGTRMRGDYAVPTLFNGNFDAIAFKREKQTIPGWSLFNGSSEDASQAYLADWYNIGVQEDKTQEGGLIGSGYLDAIGYNVEQPNYALRMGKDGAKQIVHNYLVMPEWGDLRFNLHAPYESGKLKVWLETKPETDSQGRPIINTGSHLLKEIDLAAKTGDELKTYASDIDKVGFGRGGFETFHVDSSKLDKFRGQVAKLRFEVEGNTRVYLDDVFFKSSHLEFGNPSEARYSPEEPNNNPYRENLLLQKPQYTASYNLTTKTPNWVSWQVNKSWIGGQRQADDFIADPTLPNGWPQISGSNYENNNGFSLGFNKGHIIPSGDRTRHPKDNIATFLGTNLIPQNADNNLFFSDPNNPAEASAWYNIEQLVTGMAESSKQVYVVAGSYGTNWEPQKKSNALPNDSRYQGFTDSEAFRQQGINIPTWTWKTNLVLEHPSQGVPDVNHDTKIYTFLTPNRAEPSAQDWANAGEQGIVHPFYEIGERLQLNRVLSPIKNVTEWRSPNTWLVSIEELENLLKGKNITLFSNIPGDIRDVLKQNINLPLP